MILQSKKTHNVVIKHNPSSPFSSEVWSRARPIYQPTLVIFETIGMGIHNGFLCLPKIHTTLSEHYVAFFFFAVS